MSEDLAQSFIDAGHAGDIAALEALVARGVDINIRYRDVTALAWAINDNRPQAVRWLLDHGADADMQVESGKWTPLMVAAVQGKPELVEWMLAAGANPLAGNRDGKTAEQAARDQKHDAIAARLAAAAADSPLEISYSYPLQDRVMQEIFNFARRERVTLVRQHGGGPVEAVQRESFSKLDDLSGLRKAFAEHKKRGGKMEEGEVFSNALAKTKLKTGLSR
jgi:hypothetical protein